MSEEQQRAKFSATPKLTPNKRKFNHQGVPGNADEDPIRNRSKIMKVMGEEEMDSSLHNPEELLQILIPRGEESKGEERMNEVKRISQESLPPTFDNPRRSTRTSLLLPNINSPERKERNKLSKECAKEWEIFQKHLQRKESLGGMVKMMGSPLRMDVVEGRITFEVEAFELIAHSRHLIFGTKESPTTEDLWHIIEFPPESRILGKFRKIKKIVGIMERENRDVGDIHISIKLETEVYLNYADRKSLKTAWGDCSNSLSPLREVVDYAQLAREELIFLPQSVILPHGNSSSTPFIGWELDVELFLESTKGINQGFLKDSISTCKEIEKLEYFKRCRCPSLVYHLDTGVLDKYSYDLGIGDRGSRDSMLAFPLTYEVHPNSRLLGVGVGVGLGGLDLVDKGSQDIIQRGSNQLAHEYNENTVNKNMEFEALKVLQAKCPYAGNGCQFLGPYEEILAHVNECEYEISICDFCNSRVPMKDILSHLQSCQLTLVACNECSAKYQQHEKDKHSCIKYLNNENSQLKAQVLHLSRKFEELDQKTNINLEKMKKLMTHELLRKTCTMCQGQIPAPDSQKCKICM